MGQEVTVRVGGNAIPDAFTGEVVLPPTVAADLELGQPVYCPAFGSGEVAAIEGGNIAVKFGDQERRVVSDALVTRAQAELDWHANWLRGEPWILEDGRRLLIVRDLCRHGEYQDFLDKYDLSRSTCDEHIRRYEDAVVWAAQRAQAQLQLTGNRANAADAADPQLTRNQQIKLADADRHVNDRTPDRDADERKELVGKETEKRHGRNPRYHKNLWTIRIKLPEPVLTLCREKYKAPGAKEFWRCASYAFVGLDPDVAPVQPEAAPAPTTESAIVAPDNCDKSLQVNDDAPNDLRSAPSTAQVKVNQAANDDVGDDVRSALRNQGYTAAEINKLQFSPRLGFEELMRIALKQLRQPNGTGHAGKGI